MQNAEAPRARRFAKVSNRPPNFCAGLTLQAQACDHCYRKKIKCHISSSVISSSGEAEAPCKDCLKHGRLCTFTRAERDLKKPRRTYVECHCYISHREDLRRDHFSLMQRYLYKRLPQVSDFDEYLYMSSYCNA